MTGLERFLLRKMKEYGGARPAAKALKISHDSIYRYLAGDTDSVKAGTLKRFVRDHGMTPREVLDTCGIEVTR